MKPYTGVGGRENGAVAVEEMELDEESRWCGAGVYVLAMLWVGVVANDTSVRAINSAISWLQLWMRWMR